MDSFFLSWICRCNAHQSSCLPIYSIKIYYIFIHLSTNTKRIVQMHMLLLLLVLTYQLPATFPLPLPFWGSLGTSHPRFIALWGLWTYCHIKILKLPFHWTWKEVSLCSFFPWPLQIWEYHLQTIRFKILFPIMWLLFPQYSTPHQILCDLSDMTTDSTFRIKFHYIGEWNLVFH